MISGLAPGKEAETDTVGKSTCGNGDTGSTRKAEAPDNTNAAVSSVVAMGRLMKGAEKFKGYACGGGNAGNGGLRGAGGGSVGVSAGGRPRPRQAANRTASPSKNR